MSFAVRAASSLTPVAAAPRVESSNARITGTPVAMPVTRVARAPAGIRASAEQPMKKAGEAVVAGALAVILGLSGTAGVAQAASGREIFQEQGTAASDVLEKAKAGADKAFAKAQNEGRETVGEQATPKTDSPYPKDSQISSVQGFETNPGAKGSNDSVSSDEVGGARTSGTSSQQQKTGSNIPNVLEKAFGTPVRGAEQAQGTQKGYVDREGRRDIAKAGEKDSYAQTPQLADRIKDAFSNSVTPSNPTTSGISALPDLGDLKDKAQDLAGDVKSNVSGVLGGQAENKVKSDIDATKGKVQSDINTAQAALPNLPSLPNLPNPSNLPNPVEKADNVLSKAKDFVDEQAADTKADIQKLQAEQKERNNKANYNLSF